MPRHSVLDDVWIRGQLYSIKKIQKLYYRDTGMAVKQFSMFEPGFECPECGRFNDIKGDKPKFCKHCGQRLKWPRKNKDAQV